MTRKEQQVKAALLAEADAFEALARAKRAQAEALEESGEDKQLGCDELLEEFKLGRGTVQGAVERGELTASRGARGKILVARSEIERWLRSRPYKPGPRRIEETDDGDALQDALATGELVRGAK